MSSTHNEDECLMRDRISHEDKVRELMDSETEAARAALSQQFGINGPSWLTALSYFDPTRMFVHDLMHLLYEGVLNKEVTLLLEHLIETYDLDLEELNRTLHFL